MIRRVAAAFLVVAALAAPASAADGAGGLGGVRLLYDIGRDAWLDARLAAQVDAVRTALEAGPAIPHERLGIAGDAVQVTIGGATPATAAQLADVAARLEPLRGPLPGGGFEFDLAISAGFVRFTFTEAGLAHRTRELLDLSVAAIGRRLAGMDLQAIARTQGTDRIVLTLAGHDAAEAREALAEGADLALHLVVDTVTGRPPEQAPAGLLAVPDAAEPGTLLLVEEEPVLGFADFARATVEIDQLAQTPIVQFVLTPEGARLFGEATANNVGRRMAIIVGGVAVSAPTIQGAILGGTGVIAGNFTRDEAEALADAINAGLPAPLALVELRPIDAASPPMPPDSDRGAVAVELMFVEEGPFDPAEIVTVVRRLGLGKASVQFLDAGDRNVVVTFALPGGGDDGRAKAVIRIGDALDGRFLVRAYWRLGPVFVLDPATGLVPG